MNAALLRNPHIPDSFRGRSSRGLWLWLLPGIATLAVASYLLVALGQIDDYTVAANEVGEIRAYAARIENSVLREPEESVPLAVLIDEAREHTKNAIEDTQARVELTFPAPSGERVMANFNALAGYAVRPATQADGGERLSAAVMRLTTDANALLDRLSEESAAANARMRSVLMAGAVAVLIITAAAAWGIARLNAEMEHARRVERDSAELLHQSQEVGGIGNWSVDLATGERTWSDEMFRLMGYEPGEIEPSFEAFLARVAPDDRAKQDDIVLAATIDVPASANHDLTLPDGSERVIHDEARVVRDAAGTPTHVVGFVQDVTEEHLAARGLRDSEERYRVLVDRSQNGLLLADEDGMITLGNDATCDMFGYTREQLVGQPMSILYPPEQRELRETTRDRMFRDGESLSGIPIVRVNSDGAEIDVAVSLTVLRRDGEPWATFSEYQDLRGEKRLREQLTRSQKLEAIGTLVAGVAHDFNNLLTVIGGSVEQANQRHGDSPWLDRASVATARAGDLVQQLMRFSTRTDDGRAMIDVRALAEETASLVRETSDRRVTIDVERSDAAALIWADRAQLHQLLMNLLLNANDAVSDQLRDASADAGYEPNLTLTVTPVSEHPSEFERAVTSEGDEWVEIRVADNGTGMTSDVRERIFDPFFTTKETDKGTGLGLSTVYGVVSDHGGSISVNSAPGQGSTFIVRLPVRVADTPGQDVGERQGSTDETTDTVGRVLVVDDEVIIGEILNSVLADAGYDVVAAVGGRRALTIAGSESFDLVLLDINMPGIDGWQVLDELLLSHPGLPVIMVSGYAQHAEATQRGARGLIQKPFDSSALLEAVNEHIRAR